MVADRLPTRLPGGLAAAALVAAVLVAYLPAYRCGFIWDDDVYVHDNPLLRDGAGLARIWVPGATIQYYPLVFTSFWLEQRLWGAHAAGFHAVNVLLHAANALLVWRVFSLLGVRAAWMVAAVFALHPVQVESVAWITERKNVLSGLFYLGSALWFLRFDERLEGTGGPGGATRRKWAAYAAALGLFAAALLSKTVTATLPAVLVLAMVHLRRRPTRARLAALVPFVVLGGALALNTAAVERAGVGAVGPEFELGAAERALVAARALLFYPFKILVPADLMFIYPRWRIDPASWRDWWPVAACAVTAAAAWLLWRRGVRAPGLCLGFYAVTILPALGFVSFYPMRFSFVADHFQYLAGLGMIGLLVPAVASVIRAGTLRAAAAAILLGGLGAYTFQQCRMYRDAQTLWTWTAAVNPGAWIARNNLGVILRDQGRFEEADGHFRAAILARPDLPEAHFGYGESLSLQGRLEEAYHEYRLAAVQAARQEDAIRRHLRPGGARPSVALHRRTAGVLARLGRFRDALAWHRAAVARDPRDAAAILALARILAACPDGGVRDGGEAVALAEPLAAALGGDPWVLDTLAAAYAEAGRLDEAIATASRALDLARGGGPGGLAGEVEERLEGYRAGRAWREPAPQQRPANPASDETSSRN